MVTSIHETPSGDENFPPLPDGGQRPGELGGGAVESVAPLPQFSPESAPFATEPVDKEAQDNAEFLGTTWGMYIVPGGKGKRPQIMLDKFRLPVSPLAVKLVELLMENPDGLAKRTLHLRLGMRLGSKVAPREVEFALAAVKDQLGRFGHGTEIQELERVRPAQASVPIVIVHGVIAASGEVDTTDLSPGIGTDGKNSPPSGVPAARSWAQAACRDADPEIFASDSEEQIRSAREFCRRCPIVAMCLGEALRTDTYDKNPYNVKGVLGGLTLGERQEFARRGGLGSADAHAYWQREVGIPLDAPIR